ncbi:TIGR01777 family oxidoreductase [Bdellovibrio sp. HCB2-146]|uniref:TIGR01777 family oxidoreductase n=1 Tax=Bdellovibrio sp. HCB2-146 TaxID=3394362 RepID=UPI0039BC29A2
MKILITGATGLIGKEVGKVLAEKGHEIFVVARDKKRAISQLPFPCEIIEGDLGKGTLTDTRLNKIEAVINLMGESVVGERWTDKKKNAIRTSRVDGTRHLVQSLSQAPLKAFISGSAIGYYGDCGPDIVSEEHRAGTDFLAQICVDWENEAAKAPCRSVFIRTGVVLSRRGGALDKMLLPFRLGLGGAIGKGHQWMSWIHIKDIVGLFVMALENPKAQGAINGTAPRPATNKDFSQALASALRRRLGPPIPALAIKTVFGEAGTAILSSIRASAVKAEGLGYQFYFNDLEEAFENICAPLRNGEEIFYSEQFIPENPEEVFLYFRNAHNLEELTPPTLNFNIESISTPEIQQGTIINYRLKIHGVPVKWKTEIDEWQPPYKFVDNQVKGPYSLWHHTHEFRPYCGGTLMIDKVRYRLPMGALGWLCGLPWVRKEVDDIFNYRRQKIMTAYFATHAGK